MAVERDSWSNPVEFFLSCIGYAVGLGNLWRFPYLCMKHGGGAFLIPYFTCLFICGMPLFFLEMLMGQYTSSSCIKLWNVVPIFRGVGWSSMLVSALSTIYYNVIMCWVFFYLFNSFSWTLPWSTCTNSWNNRNDNVTCFSYLDLLKNQSQSNNSSSWSGNDTRVRSSGEEFWLFNTLDTTKNIDEVGGFRWQLVLCFILSWFIVYLCLFKGIKSSGKVVYITAVAPYIFIAIILIKGATLPGSLSGVLFYITPKWEMLCSFDIWSTAAVQIFYALGSGWGGIITFGSYNRFHYNCLRDSIVLPIVCCLTSFYFGFAIFTVLGHMAHVLDKEVNHVVQVGPGLVFVAYPEALSQLPGSAVWAVLFFLMLITLGLDSQFATLETAITGLVDEFPNTVGKYKKLFTLTFVVGEILLGLIFTTQAGVYFFQIVDWYLSAYSVVAIVFMELLGLVFVFNVTRVLQCAEEMLGPLPRWLKLWWTLAWCILTPICLQVVNVTVIMGTSEPHFAEDHSYPRWAIVMGWCVAALPTLPIPIVAVLVMCQVGVRDWRQWFLPNKEFCKLAAAHHSRASIDDSNTLLLTSFCDGGMLKLEDSLPCHQIVIKEEEASETTGVSSTYL